MSEEHVIFYLTELIVAIDHIHKNGIAYRDVKLDNIVLDVNGHVRLVDFGLCKKLSPPSRTYSYCGTVEYMAPEIVKGTGHGHDVDWWALGVVAIELLTQEPPFGVQVKSEDVEVIKKNITNRRPTMPKHISKNMNNFLLKLLTKNPDRRLGTLLDVV